MPDPTPEPAELGKLLDALVHSVAAACDADIGLGADDPLVQSARSAVWAEVQRLLREAQERALARYGSTWSGTTGPA